MLLSFWAIRCGCSTFCQRLWVGNLSHLIHQTLLSVVKQDKQRLLRAGSVREFGATLLSSLVCVEGPWSWLCFLVGYGWPDAMAPGCRWGLSCASFQPSWVILCLEGRADLPGLCKHGFFAQVCRWIVGKKNVIYSRLYQLQFVGWGWGGGGRLSG